MGKKRVIAETGAGHTACHGHRLRADGLDA